MKINDNVTALQVYTNLLKTNRKIDNSVLKLSSGYRINSVSDDAAGSAISNKLKNQINGLEMAARNTLDGISLIQTAEGALGEVHAMLNRIREIAVQTANDTMEPDDREKMQMEVEVLLDEIYDTATKTEFNTIKVLRGDAEEDAAIGFEGLKIQIGANKDMSMTINIPDIRKELDRIAKMNSSGAGLVQDPPDPAGPPYPLADPNNPNDPVYGDATDAKLRVNVNTVADSTETMGFCDDAIAQVSIMRARLGAYQNRLEHTEVNLSATSMNTKEALSRIFDTDMAIEMSYNVQNGIVSQAAIAILGQANQRPQQIIQLLQ